MADNSLLYDNDKYVHCPKLHTDVHSCAKILSWTIASCQWKRLLMTLDPHVRHLAKHTQIASTRLTTVKQYPHSRHAKLFKSQFKLNHNLKLPCLHDNLFKVYFISTGSQSVSIMLLWQSSIVLTHLFVVIVFLGKHIWWWWWCPVKVHYNSSVSNYVPKWNSTVVIPRQQLHVADQWLVSVYLCTSLQTSCHQDSMKWRRLYQDEQQWHSAAQQWPYSTQYTVHNSNDNSLH